MRPLPFLSLQDGESRVGGQVDFVSVGQDVVDFGAGESVLSGEIGDAAPLNDGQTAQGDLGPPEWVLKRDLPSGSPKEHERPPGDSQAGPISQAP